MLIRRCRLQAGLVFSFLLSCSVLAQSPASDIPDTLEVQEISDPDTLKKMQRCNPRIGSETFDRMLQKQAKNDATSSTAFTSPGERTAVIEKRGLWMCVHLSPSRYPILSIDTLTAAAKPIGGDPARIRAFFQAIGRSLAETGFARALVTYASTGNANALLFAVNAEQPSDLAVETRFLKKGEFNPDEYSLRLDDPTVTGLSTARAGRSGTQVDIFQDKHAKRAVVGGYLIRTGNDRTRRFSFGGTTWKSPVPLSTTFSFEREGVLLYRAKTGTSFGSWKMDDGVLYFDINKTTFYSAVLDDKDYLNVEARRAAAPLASGGNALPSPAEHRFTLRLYQEGNVAAEKEAREKAEAAVKAIQVFVEMRKNEVLAESPADEQRLQGSGSKRQTLCEGELLTMVTMVAFANDLKPGELCHSYIGSRNDWKTTVLKEGCKGRCAAF